MTMRLRSLLALGAGTLALGACGNGSNNSSVPPSSTPVVTAEGKFGTCFATRFDAQADTKATDPVPCTDLPAPSLTTKPNAI